MRRRRRHVLNQVDGHVVRRRKGTAQRERSGRRQAGDLGRIGHLVGGVPQHDGVALDVDAAAPGASGQLGVLPRRQRGVLLAVVLDQPFQHDGAGRHVDAQSQCLRGEDGFHQTGGEQLLDGVPEHRQQSGVVGGQAAQQAFAPFVIVEHHQIGLGQIGTPAVDDLGDPVAFGLVGQAHRGTQALLDRGIAPGAREHERDGRQQPGLVQRADDVGPARWPVHRGPAAGASAPVSAASPGLPVHEPVRLATMRDVPQQLRIDAGLTLAATLASVDALGQVEQVEEPLAHQHVLPQRHRAVFIDDDGRVTANSLNPAAELLGVTHRRRQADQPDLVGQMQDHFLPHRAAHAVGQEVHLVHHHIGQSVQCMRIGVEHVAQHFGGHHHDVRVTVDRLVAGEQADAFGSVAGHQIVVLLVAQRLDRRGVEALPPGGQRQVHRELADDGLAGTGRGTDQDTATVLERDAGVGLKGVQGERQARGEVAQLRTRLGVRRRCGFWRHRRLRLRWRRHRWSAGSE